MSDYFSCDLFKDNDPELAEKVKGMHAYVGMDGLSKYEMPWVEAKSFVNFRGQVYENLSDLQLQIAVSKGSRVSYWADAVYTYLFNASSYQSFKNRLKKAVKMLSDNSLREVAYMLEEKSSNHTAKPKGGVKGHSDTVKNILQRAKRKTNNGSRRRNKQIKRTYKGKQRYKRRIKKWLHKRRL